MVDNLMTEKQILAREHRAQRNLVRDEWSHLVREQTEKDDRKKLDDKVANEEEEPKNRRRTSLGTETNDKRDPTCKPEEESQYVRI